MKEDFKSILGSLFLLIFATWSVYAIATGTPKHSSKNPFTNKPRLWGFGN